jgi:hypothetical protein
MKRVGLAVTPSGRMFGMWLVRISAGAPDTLIEFLRGFLSHFRNTPRYVAQSATVCFQILSNSPCRVTSLLRITLRFYVLMAVNMINVFCHEDGGSSFLRNIAKFPREYVVLNPRIQQSLRAGIAQSV